MRDESTGFQDDHWATGARAFERLPQISTRAWNLPAASQGYPGAVAGTGEAGEASATAITPRITATTSGDVLSMKSRRRVQLRE